MKIDVPSYYIILTEFLISRLQINIFFGFNNRVSLIFETSLFGLTKVSIAIHEYNFRWDLSMTMYKKRFAIYF